MFAKVALALPLYRLFDYLLPEGVIPPIGCRVEVPFANRHKVGFVVAISPISDFAPDKLKAISRVLDTESLLSPTDVSLLHWASEYYHEPVGEVFSKAFPANLRKSSVGAKPAPISEYALTSAGLGIDPVSLNRSPKQQNLLLICQQTYPKPVSKQQLSELPGNWRPALKCFLDKQWLVPLAGPSVAFTGNLNTPTDIPLILNDEQEQVVAEIVRSLGKFAVFLLEGVTGSGKTEVYLQVIRTVLDRQEQALVLVPEINLTPQMEQRFRKRFPVAMAVSHSGLSDKQRQLAWQGMQQGEAAILLGTRSTIFTPMLRAGLIILDEEHDSSYKQQEGFRFSARDVAIMRAKILGIPVVLGSATPSLESLHNVQKQRFQLLSLKQRAGHAVAPEFSLLDIRNKPLFGGLSETLLAEIAQTLAKNEQVILFLNRRGFAPTLICHDCAWLARCSECDANLVIHYQERRLRCHHCGREHRMPTSCPNCQSNALHALGLGTERIEETLREHFPNYISVRLDRDTIQGQNALTKCLEQIHTGQAQLIIGTQMLSKGHHFPEVTLAALVDVDSGLFSVDYRASERLAQLIVQVAGRAGRAEKVGKVILQTRYPQHPLLIELVGHGYRRFAKWALAERRLAHLPPYTYQALFRAQGKQAEAVIALLQGILKKIQSLPQQNVQVFGPVPAPMPKRESLYRFQLLLQSRKRIDLHELLNQLTSHLDQDSYNKAVRWSLDVDPIDLY